MVDWWNMCPGVCGQALLLEPQLVGIEENPVQVDEDESYFYGRRKTNLGQVPVTKKIENVCEDISDWGDEVEPTEHNSEAFT